MEIIDTIDGVVTAVGGPAEAVRLAGAKSSSPTSIIWNWKDRGRIPPEHFAVFSDALARDGRRVDPRVFGQTPAPAEPIA